MQPVRSRFLFCAVALAALRFACAGVSSAQAADKRNADFAQVLPAETTTAVIVVENFFKTASFDEKSPVGRLLEEPAVKIWTRDLLPDHLPDLQETYGLTSKDLPRLFSGKAAAAAMMKHDGAGGTASSSKKDDDSSLASLNMSMQFDGLGLIEFLGSAAEYEELAGKLEAQILKRYPKADIKRERVEGVTLRSIEVDPGEGDAKDHSVYSALYNDTIIVATSRPPVLEMINALSRGVVTNPLSGRSDYIAARKEVGANDGFFFANLSVVMPFARTLMTKAFEESNKANTAAKAFIDPKTVVDALALENFSALYGSLTISEQQVAARYGLTWKDQVGLAKLVQFGRTPVAVPSYASADYKGVDVSTADYPAIWDAGSSLIQAAFPAAYPMIGMSIAANPKANELVAKLRKGVLDNLEQEVVTLTGFPTADPADDELPGKVVVFRVKDPVAAQAAVEALLARIGEAQGKPDLKPDSRDYLGTKIYRVPLPPGMFPGQNVPDASDDEDSGDEGDDDKDDKQADHADADEPDDAPAKAPQPTRLSYAFVDDRVICSAGADNFIEGVIANLQKPGRPIAAGRFQDELGDLPGTPCSLAYGDVSTYLMSMLNEGIRAGTYKKANLTRADFVKARAAAKDLHYFWAGKSFYSPGGFFGRIVVAEDKPDSN